MARKKDHKNSSLSRRCGVRNIKQTFLIVCEGEKTEPDYFNAFRMTSATVKAVGRAMNTMTLVAKDNETDNLFEYNFMTPDEEYNTKYQTRFHLKYGSNTVDVPVYSGIMSGMGDERFRSGFVDGSLYKHPQRNLVIQPLQYMDYILFFDLDNDSYFAVHQTGSMSFEEEITDDPYIHFSDCVCTDNWFLIDHLDENNVESYLVFDWEGKCIARFIPNVFPQRLSYDESSQTLYGVNVRTDSVYKFDLSGLLP